MTPSRSLPKELNATGDGDGDNGGMGGRDGIERQTTTAGRVAPGKGRIRVHPGRMQDGGGAEADTGRCQPVALAGPPIVGGRQRWDGRQPRGRRR